jgi:hypothetical protein
MLILSDRIHHEAREAHEDTKVFSAEDAVLARGTQGFVALRAEGATICRVLGASSAPTALSLFFMLFVSLW